MRRIFAVTAVAVLLAALLAAGCGDDSSKDEGAFDEVKSVLDYLSAGDY